MSSTPKIGQKNYQNIPNHTKTYRIWTNLVLNRHQIDHTVSYSILDRNYQSQVNFFKIII